MNDEEDGGASFWQIQQQLEYELWLADEAAQAEYLSWSETTYELNYPKLEAA